MDRGYDSRVGSSLDVQEIDSGQPLSLTLQQHGLGGLFFCLLLKPVQLFVFLVRRTNSGEVSFDSFSAVFLVDRFAMIAYIYTHQPDKGGRHG